jgi:CubicO group peptidase (beta-lactamase class C family)
MRLVSPMRIGLTKDDGAQMDIHGNCRTGFDGVREAFAENFRTHGEVGASVCVIVDGETVVDLWGGLAERRAERPWERDTIGVVFSCTKGMIALCANLLVARGELDLNQTVSHYWPEFAAAGKESIPVRWLLDHQAGLPAIRTPLQPGDVYDWERFTTALAAETPFWTPGTRQGYHAVTFGHLVGEVIRRITTDDVGTFFHQQIADPLGLDLHLGLVNEADEARVAPTLRPDMAPRGEPSSRFLEAMNRDPAGPQALIVRNTGRRPGDLDSREAHAALLPSSGALGNARSLAGMYAPLALGGSFKGVHLVDEESIATMGSVSSATAIDAVLLVRMRFGLGFMKSSDNRDQPPEGRDSLVLSESAFGHAGMGGSLGFADPAARLAFGYTMNKQGRGVLLNERGQALVDATYRALGYRSSASGRWVRG